jgi:hypothetical protein
VTPPATTRTSSSRSLSQGPEHPTQQPLVLTKSQRVQPRAQA